MHLAASIKLAITKQFNLVLELKLLYHAFWSEPERALILIEAQLGLGYRGLGPFT